jgi:hypothetical protein
MRIQVSRLAVAAILALGLAGCGAPAPGAGGGGESPEPDGPSIGVWELSDIEAVDATTERLDVEVTRLECSGGVTGEVLEPVVTLEADRILIRTDVAPLPEGNYDCQGNDRVPVTIELGEPVGDRELVDAACLEETASSTGFCQDDGVRWRPSV